MLSSSVISVIHDCLSLAGWIEDRGVALYEAIKKGDECKVAETLNWPLCPRYAEIPQNDEILKHAVLVYPYIASRLLEHYKNEISDNVIIEIFHAAVKRKCIKGIIVLLQHCASKILPKSEGFSIGFEEMLADMLCYAAAEGKKEVVTLLLESFGEKISPDAKWGAYRSAKREDRIETAEILKAQPDIFFMFGRKQVHFHPIISSSDSPSDMPVRVHSYAKGKVRG